MVGYQLLLIKTVECRCKEKNAANEANEQEVSNIAPFLVNSIDILTGADN